MEGCQDLCYRTIPIPVQENYGSGSALSQDCGNVVLSSAMHTNCLAGPCERKESTRLVTACHRLLTKSQANHLTDQGLSRNPLPRLISYSGFSNLTFFLSPATISIWHYAAVIAKWVSLNTLQMRGTEVCAAGSALLIIQTPNSAMVTPSCEACCKTRIDQNCEQPCVT